MEANISFEEEEHEQLTEVSDEKSPIPYSLSEAITLFPARERPREVCRTDLPQGDRGGYYSSY